MQTMTVRSSPVVRSMIAAAAMVIVVFGLKFASDVFAPILFAATLAILFTPLLRWLENKGLPPGLALLVMVLGLGGLIMLLIIILTASLEQLSLRLPVYQELLHQRIDALGAALGNIGIDVQDALNVFVADTTALTKSAINAVLGVLGMVQMLWRVDPRAWMFLVFITTFELILDFMVMLGSATWQDVSVSFILNAIILIYCMLPGVRRAFGTAY